MGDDPKDTRTLEPTDQGLADPKVSSVLIIGVGVIVVLGLAGFGFAFDHLSSEMRAENQALRGELHELGMRGDGLTPPPAPVPQPVVSVPAEVNRADLLTTRATAFGIEVRSGRISQITGALDPAPAVGEQCVVEVWPVARLYGDFNCRVRIYCGSYALYGPSVGRPEGDAWAWNLCGVRDGSPTYAHDIHATGPDGDPRLELRLPENRVIVSDDDPEYAIEIRLDAAGASSERPPAALFGPMDFEPEVRFGSISSATGIDGLATAQRCTLVLWPRVPNNEDEPLNGRVRVRCGQTELYGPSVGDGAGTNWGWARVGVRDGRATRAFDPDATGDDGDPALTLDLPARRVVVSDGPERRVEIRLER